MNELNECIVLLWVSGSPGRRKRIIFCTYCQGGLIKPFSIYLIHTLTVERLIACVCVEMADLFHSRPFFDANMPAIPRSSASSTRILLQSGYEVL